MKKSVICILGIMFLIGVATTATSSAFDLVAQNVQKLNIAPGQNIFKLDPNAVKNLRGNAMGKMSEFTHQWKVVTDRVALTQSQLTLLQNRATALARREEECMNKPWTTAEVGAAQCTNDIVACSKKLFTMCVKNEAAQLYETVSAFWAYVGTTSDSSNGRGLTTQSLATGKIFEAWYFELTPLVGP